MSEVKSSFGFRSARNRQVWMDVSEDDLGESWESRGGRKAD